MSNTSKQAELAGIGRALDELRLDHALARFDALGALAEDAPPAERAAYYDVLARTFEIRERTSPAKRLAALQAAVDADPDAPPTQRAVRWALLGADQLLMGEGDGRATFERALALAPDDATRAAVLLHRSQIDEPDARSALIEAAAIARRTTVAPRVAVSIWGHVLNFLDEGFLSKRDQKTVARELEEHGFERGVPGRLDAYRRIDEAARTGEVPLWTRITYAQGWVSTLAQSGQLAEARAKFDELTPLVRDAAGTELDPDVVASWFDIAIRAMRLGAEAAELEQLRDQLVARAEKQWRVATP